MPLQDVVQVEHPRQAGLVPGGGTRTCISRLIVCPCTGDGRLAASVSEGTPETLQPRQDWSRRRAQGQEPQLPQANEELRTLTLRRDVLVTSSGPP